MSSQPDKALERKLRSLEAARRQRIDKFDDAAMGTAEGRDFFFDLLGRCKIGQSGFTGNALSGSFNQGEQNVGLQVEAHIKRVAPRHFLTMLEERLKEDENVRSLNTASSAELDQSASDADSPYSD